MQQTSQQPIDSGSIGWAVLGFILPIVGIILNFAWRHTRPASARQANRGALASLFLGLLWTLPTRWSSQSGNSTTPERQASNLESSTFCEGVTSNGVYSNSCFDLSYTLESGFKFEEEDSGQPNSRETNQDVKELVYTTDMAATNDDSGEIITVVIVDTSNSDPNEVPSAESLEEIGRDQTKRALEERGAKDIQITNEEISIAKYECPATAVSYTLSGSAFYMESSTIKKADGIAIFTVISLQKERPRQILDRFTTIDQAPSSTAEDGGGGSGESDSAGATIDASQA